MYFGDSLIYLPAGHRVNLTVSGSRSKVSKTQNFLEPLQWDSWAVQEKSRQFLELSCCLRLMVKVSICCCSQDATPLCWLPGLPSIQISVISNQSGTINSKITPATTCTTIALTMEKMSRRRWMAGFIVNHIPFFLSTIKMGYCWRRIQPSIRAG